MGRLDDRQFRRLRRLRRPAPAAGWVTTNHGTLTADLDDLGLADVVLDAGGLGGKYAPSAYRWKTRTARSASRPVWR